MTDLTLEDIERMQKALDESEVPQEGRIIRTTEIQAYTLLTLEFGFTHKEALEFIENNRVDGYTIEFRS